MLRTLALHLRASAGGGSDRWYTWAHSGSGALRGTGAEVRTWKHWKLGGHPDGLTDEAVWILDRKNSASALEVGFSSGIGADGFSRKMYPYCTTDNGRSEHDFFTELPKNKTIWMSASTNGRRSWAFIHKKYYAKAIHYGVHRPRLTYEQAEVNYHNIWMGGGSGSSLALEYETSNGRKWVDWGYIRGHEQHPYKIQVYQPNGAHEGGYGSRC